MTIAERTEALVYINRMQNDWQRIKRLARDTISIYNHVDAVGDDLAAIETDLMEYVPERRGRTAAVVVA